MSLCGAVLALALSLQPARPDFMIHVMPWFVYDSQTVGWHWTMNKKPEEVRRTGKVASHYTPLIGPYDSADPKALDLHIGWMKLAGFDGVLADWYGAADYYDYVMINERTKALFAAATKAKMKIGVVYEDQSVGNPVKNGLANQSLAPSLANEAGTYLNRTWITQPNWWRLGGRPVVMVFGPQFFTQVEWSAFKRGSGDILLLTLHKITVPGEGGFDWPIPDLGLEFTKSFASRSHTWKQRIGGAFPRFHDWYEEGGQKGYKDIPDRDGATYRETLQMALDLKAPALQVATWNDWQEGTQIEPSVELGMRDLAITQEARRKVDPAFKFTRSDLELPLKLYQLRKKGLSEAAAAPIHEAICRGDLASARKALAEQKV